jgi:predicted homoserine dehydrogenase-like protein
MIEEIESWAFRIVMAGNIKGFLDRHATAQGLLEEARIRNLNPVQCCAYTDGTKLNIEMALVANGTGLLPSARGMIGPVARRVNEVLELFDFGQYPESGVVDYILGAEPGGGVFVVGHCDDPLQQRYLKYYKLGAGPYYLFYRPYHLCHLETTRAIALAALYSRPVLQPTHPLTADVYAFAKRDIFPGEVAPHGIGGDHAYGLIDRCAEAGQQGLLPIALLEVGAGKVPRFRRGVERDQPIRFEDVELPDSPLLELYSRAAQSMPPKR